MSALGGEHSAKHDEMIMMMRREEQGLEVSRLETRSSSRCRGGGAEAEVQMWCRGRVRWCVRVVQRWCRAGAKVQRCKGAEVLQRCCKGGAERWCTGYAEKCTGCAEVMQ